MKLHCENCAKVMNEEFRKNYLESNYHCSLVISIMEIY